MVRERVSDTGVATLEHGRLIKNDPLFGLRWLEIFNRSTLPLHQIPGVRQHTTDCYSLTEQHSDDSGKCADTEDSGDRMRHEHTFHPAAGRIGGMYFNTGVATPGDATNDVRAFIIITRPSDSTNPSGVLDITGTVVLCNDADCTTNTPIGTVDVGTAIVNLPSRSVSPGMRSVIALFSRRERLRRLKSLIPRLWERSGGGQRR